MSSSSQSQRRSPEPQQKPTPHKIFATNLDVEVEPVQLEKELFSMFAKFGKLDSVVVKRSYNNKYCFAFVEYKEGEDASQAVVELNNTMVFGTKMKVELQDNSRRRKGPDEARTSVRNDGCYACGKPGHIAKNCREKDREERRRRSPSSEERKKKKRSRRSSSSSSRRSRRDKKERSRKIKKSKHKKQRRHSSSSSS